MHIDRSRVAMMDISKFIQEAKEKREYSDYRIETENYILMKRELFEKLEKHLNEALREMQCVNTAKTERTLN